ncbi:MAG: D-glycero-beta-D-manno-heptose-7-phosphate kinase [Candidatus Krumholzibacteriia bacterium]
MPYREMLNRFDGLRLAVCGDVMVDRFLWGRVDRISPEAPVPVVRLERETAKLGGAANVANNIRALGAAVTLVGVVGADETAGELRGMLADRGIDDAGLLTLSGRPTTLKTRIIAHHQQVVRTDVESDVPLSGADEAQLLERLRGSGPYDALVLSDYGKGVLSSSLLPGVIAWAREAGTILTVDPKRGDFCQYRGVTSLTPNQKEAGQACSTLIGDPETLDRVGRLLRERVDAEALLITRGEHGMALYERGGAVHHLPTEATEVFDVTGAGDTVIAAFTTALAAGATWLEAANFANHAAGLAVRELGTAAITAAQIAEVMGL